MIPKTALVDVGIGMRVSSWQRYKINTVDDAHHKIFPKAAVDTLHLISLMAAHFY